MRWSLLLLFFLLLPAAQAFGAASAGYSEYFIPGDDALLIQALDNVGGGDQTIDDGHMHSVISVTAWSDDTEIYYDHWENGYGFDPDDPGTTADETYTLSNRGDSRIFESKDIPTYDRFASDPDTYGRNPADTDPDPIGTPSDDYYYDGRDRIYIAGGAVTVSRAAWAEAAGTLQAVAWEVYPVRPQLTTYILPFGEDLVASGYDDFDRVYALIQATQDGTVVTIDRDGDGNPDQLDIDRDGDFDGTSVTLNRGEVFLLDRKAVTNNFALDDFTSGIYSSGTGWNGNWTETSDDGTAGGGDILIDADKRLRISNIGGGALPSIERSLDLSGAASAWLAFDYATAGGVDGTDDIQLQIYNGSVWTTLRTFEGQISGFYEADISIYRSSDTRVRFRVSANYGGTNEYFYVDDLEISETESADNTIDTGTRILASDTVQVQYVIGDQGTTYEVRGLSAFPRGFWDDEYYAPVDSPEDWDDATDPDPTDIYLYNPHGDTITITYETRTGSGSFEIPSKSTRSYSNGTGGAYVPEDSSVYLKGTDVFWGISTIDAEGTTHDWGYSLVPAFLLENEHFLGWAPGAYEDPITADDRGDSGVYVAAAQDNIILYVDYDGDGYDEAGDGDQSFPLSRLETLYVYDPYDGDMSNANVFATGPYVMAYGQNPDIAPPAVPAIDVGYTTIPGNDFIELVFTVDKSVSPQVVPTSSGSQAQWTLEVNTYDFSVDSISVTDTLPSGWEYVAGSTVITLPDNTQVTGGTADDGNSTGDTTLTWSGSDVFGTTGLAANQEITITFTARTTQEFTTGTISKNDVKAVGSRTVEGVTQTFSTTDFAFVTYGNYEISKTSDGVDPLSPGDQFEYTVTVTNPDVPVRATEYYIGAGEFTGNTYDLTLDQDLADDYFVIIRGSDGDGSSNRGPDETYAALTADPNGTGELSSSGGSNVITLTRGNAEDEWIGVVTVVESPTDQGTAGFNLLDVQRVSHASGFTGGTDTSGTAWSDIDQVMLMGGFYGPGCDTNEPGNANHPTCWARIYPSGTNTINWTRDDTEGSLGAATSTVMVLEWGDEWTIQRVNVTGSNGGDGLDASGEYNTAAISSVARENTWVWGVGHTDDNGLTDGAEGAIITLGNGQTESTNETTVAVGTEDSGTNVDFEVYALTHPEIQVDYEFKADGDQNELTVDIDVESAGSNRMALAYNGSNGGGTAYPRPIFSARYIDSDTIRMERRYDGQDFPAWVQGIEFPGITLTGIAVYDPIPNGATYVAGSSEVTEPDGSTSTAGAPPNFVTSGDGYSLAPGETLTLTFDVTVEDPFPTGQDEIVNTVSVTTNEFAVPLTAQVSNLVNNPSAETGEVGDLVWLDTDGDGFKDPGESGLSNVQLTLKDQFGTPLAVTTTDGTGRYRFTGIEPGDDYYVQVTGGLPSGLVQSAPSGHSDNKTDSFDLLAGGVYLDADLGYTNAAGKGSIGDFVWNDDDGDGIQDSGELGLSGVTVQLYLDVNNDGVFEPGGADGNAVATTVTGPDGTYLFNNVNADDGNGTDDYFVYVDATQAALSGYDYTTSPVTRVIDLADGQVSLVNDFGFANTSGSTYTYADRVWFDADDGGDLDSGETGISGVTVNLLNASRQVVATVTTNANGEFSFSGLSGGTFYYVAISDTAGKLTDYYGTTTPAIAGELQISNLTGDVDNTDDPNFGYNAKGAIGDTVFNDVDGDGTQDAGELGISGVTVKLYNDDDGDGVIDAGDDQVLATVTTDPNGNYMFSGLADGDYIVSIETPPADYDYTGTGAMADEDASTNGAQVDVEISGGSNLDVDFGFQVPQANQRSISGTIWNDLDNDGLTEGDFDGNSYLSNVTVELRDSGGGLVGTTTTNSSGLYTFTGLPDGTYTVRVTDDNNVLSGYDTTYEVDEGAKAGPYDGKEEVTVNSGNPSPSNIHFGYYNPPVITRAVIGEFGAFNDSDKVVVRWETLSEQGTLGFYLQRLDENTGDYESVNRKLLPGFLFNASGGWYQVEDKGAKTDENYTYRLVEVEILGKRNIYGPWEVYTGTPVSADASGVEYRSVKSFSGFERSPRVISEFGKDRLASKMVSKLKNFAEKLSRRGNQAKISVSEDGLYYVSVENIAEVLNMNSWYIERLIKWNRIALENRGEAVAVMPAADKKGLYFYGQALSTRYTDENVYWLSIGKSSIMNAVKGRKVKPGEGPAWFIETVQAEEEHYGLTNIFDDPSVDFWMWDYAFLGSEYGKEDIIVSVVTPGATNALNGNVMVVVELQGATDVSKGPDHQAMVSLNGTVIGETIWDGVDRHIVSFEADPALLSDGENTITITGIKTAGVDYNIFYLNKIEVSYPRAYQVADDQLASVNDTGNGLLTIKGFTDDAIVVLDLTEPNQPEMLSRTSITQDLDNPDHFQVSFNAAVDQVLIFSATLSSARPAELIADQASILKTRFNWGDYLVIISGEMIPAAEALAAYRSSQGYLAKVVDIEDIYDEFSHGITDAEAIRDFLAYAYQNWRRPPQFVLLAGDGSYDYKDCMGFGAPAIPPLLVGTPDGLFVTDNPYADITGDDGVPEIALGRLPVVSEEELLGYIEKVKAYEAGGDWEKRALFAADKPEAGADFPADSDRMSDLFPMDFTLNRIYLNEISLNDGRQAFVERINTGVAYVNFIGHGGIDLIGNHRLFSANEMVQLNNVDRAPVVTAMTCASGNFGFLGFDALNEVMVTKSGGGATAMWSPSGFADNALSLLLCEEFYGAIFENGEMTIGEAIRQAQAAFIKDAEYRHYLDLYNLLGDPALRVKK